MFSTVSVNRIRNLILLLLKVKQKYNYQCTLTTRQRPGYIKGHIRRSTYRLLGWESWVSSIKLKDWGHINLSIEYLPGISTQYLLHTMKKISFAWTMTHKGLLFVLQIQAITNNRPVTYTYACPPVLLWQYYTSNVPCTAPSVISWTLILMYPM